MSIADTLLNVGNWRAMLRLLTALS